MSDQDQQRARELAEQIRGRHKDAYADEPPDWAYDLDVREAVDLIAAALAAVREEGREERELIADYNAAALETNEAIQRAEEAVQITGRGTHAQRIDHLVAQLSKRRL